ncbi:thiaminase II [Commensalibacter papalotli (ex Botero et al. 2024)]|uniref:Aminopyrimidine aminohydrolase n=1 Tax=Commensalibacter papalotli (ex Botero et al. 2024) TaxID=2972766 RepID=A0ABM9HN84_9PROT|nr:thiaminase II [Commensalibacter papalotli (ex Botero et al. 2024)]CAI3936322.1 Aminopyrimidine aminohydrolase TenA (thiamine salvage pathway) (TenA) (PDB:2QCX) (PUBMED:17618314) [Commensalibacter papalotli (ex Botero et al. 2024)]CAI3939353.1 Aminopyrimidine aminohydrolase TenA (thiamine salvage pathway) (TenA) (PDB:2QCX) (PUBMED:17618314) [Commensalibacter papalotli (ex Botero et al. 2024)]
MSDVIKDTLSLFDQGLIGRFRRDCQNDWLQFTQHRFVKELAAGTLEQKEFQQFLIQDYLYLHDYCRVVSLAIYKSNDFTEMQYFASLMQGLLNAELPFHIKYCQERGITQGQIEKSSKTLELVAYSQYLLSKSMQGDLLDLIVLLSPCLVGYGEIGLRMSIDKCTNIKNNPYQSWLNTYTDSLYIDLIKKSFYFIDELGKKYGAEQRYQTLLEKFTMSVRLESAFWNVGRANLLGAIS